MEFGRRAAGEAPSSSVEGYFTSQALHAGLLRDVGRSSIPAPPLSSLITSREVLKREFQREQVRDDLTGRRILEEEVRRELDLERAMADRLGRLRSAPLYPDANRLPLCPPEARVRERPGAVPGPFTASRQRPKVEFVERIPLHARHLHPNAAFLERMPHQDPQLHPDVGFVERLPIEDPRQRLEVGFIERLPLRDPHQLPEDGMFERLPRRDLYQHPDVRFTERLPHQDLYQLPEAGFVDRLSRQDPHYLEDRAVDRLARPGPGRSRDGRLGEMPAFQFRPKIVARDEKSASHSGPQIRKRLPEREGITLTKDPHYLEVGAVERLARPVSGRSRDARLGEMPVFRFRPKIVTRDKKSTSHSGPQIRKRFREKEGITLTKGKPMRSGVKRKAESSAGAEDFHQLPAKKWKCILCKVFTTCEHGLKEHLEGKKHKTMEESLNTDKPTTQDSAGLTSIATNKSKDSVKAKVNHKLLSAKKNTNAKKAKNPFRCNVCDVQCNSQDILNLHLAGKKHKLQLGESKEKPDLDGRKDKPAQMEKPAAIQESDKKPANDGKLEAAEGPEGNNLPAGKGE